METTFIHHRTAITIGIKNEILHYRFLIVVKLYLPKKIYIVHIHRIIRSGNKKYCVRL